MTQGVPEELRIKRKELDKIDREIIDLLTKRLEIVNEITEIKRRYNIPVFDKSREEQVLRTREVWGLERGLDWRFVSDVFKTIIEESRSLQLYAPEKLRIGIYGYGNMAKTLAEVFSKAGHEVIITGRDLEKARDVARSLKVDHGTAEDVARKAEWFIIATPPDAVIQVAKELMPKMRAGALVSDISSVKKGVIDEMVKILPEYIEYISIHPLFGPGVDPLGETVVLIPVKSYDYWIKKVNSVLVSMGLEVITATPEEHDKAMAITQALHHFAILSLKRTMDELSKEFGVNYEGFSTYSFKRTLDTIRRLEELMDVVLEIQRKNVYSKSVRRKFLEVARRLDEELS